MAGEIFGSQGVFLILLVAVVGIGVPLWALVDAASRPGAAFSAANSSKALWVTLIVVFWFFTGIIGFVLAVVYLTSIRPRVVSATG